MSPEGEDWTHPEIVRELKRTTRALETLSSQLATLSTTFVTREVWDVSWERLGDWQRERGVDIVNLEAEQARVRLALDAARHERIVANRWALGIGVSAAGVVSAIVGLVLP